MNGVNYDVDRSKDIYSRFWEDVLAQYRALGVLGEKVFVMKRSCLEKVYGVCNNKAMHWKGSMEKKRVLKEEEFIPT